MEAILFLLIICLLLYIISNQKKEIGQLRDGLKHTFDELISIKKLIESLNSNVSPQAPENIINEPAPSPQVIIKEEEIEASPYVQEEEILAPVTEVREELVEEVVWNTPIPLPIPEYQPAISRKKVIAEPRMSWYEKFKENNPDLEKFIGENLINKIGIIILVLGISFFLRYAIAKEWINEPTRVGIGILTGGSILIIAHRLRLKFKAFSSVLVAGAIAVFYFTIAIAFHDYQLFSQTTAFAIMTVITLFSVFVSIAYDRQELGVLSTLAGFAVPFMVSSGDGNYHVLLTYLLILNSGMLIISYYKRWFIVNFTALIATIIVVFGWYSTLENPNTNILNNALIYFSFSYFIFTIAFIINNVVHKNKFANYEIGALLSSTALYFAIGCHIIHRINPDYMGLFSITLGFINILFAYTIYKKYRFDKNIIYALIGLALTLATVTLPIQFEGNYITIFWACEAVLLFWLSQKSNMKGFTLAGIIVQILAFISLIMNIQYYAADQVPYVFMFNLNFITGLIFIGSLLSTHWLFSRHDFSFRYFELDFKKKSYRILVFNLALILGYALPLLEVHYKSNAFFTNAGTNMYFKYLYHMLYTSALLYILHKKNNIQRWGNILIAFNMLVYILLGYRLPIYEKEETFYGLMNFPYAFNFHYLSLTLLLYQVWLYVRQHIFEAVPSLTIKSFAPWFVAFFITYMLSVETTTLFLFQTANWPEFYMQKKFVIKVIFPVLWGVISFALLIFGIKKQIKAIRIIALALLSITILKLFTYDIRDVSETGKIIAFILLGVLILIISFVYQKIKKLVVENDKKTL